MKTTDVQLIACQTLDIVQTFVSAIRDDTQFEVRPVLNINNAQTDIVLSQGNQLNQRFYSVVCSTRVASHA